MVVDMSAVMSSEIAELAKALSKAQGELPNVPKGELADVKSKTGASYKYWFCDISACVAVCSPVLSRHGLSVSQPPHPGADTADTAIVTILLHDSGQWIRSVIRLPYSGSDYQEHGKAITYFRRYAYLAILGVAAEDDDAKGASEAARAEAARLAAERQSATRSTPRAAAAGPSTVSAPEDANAAEAKRISARLDELAQTAGTMDSRWTAVAEDMRKLPSPYFVPDATSPGVLQLAFKKAKGEARRREEQRQ